MTKQVAVFGAAVMTTLLALVVFWQFRIVAVYIMASLALAATVRPLILNWKKHGWVMRVVLILLYLVGFGGFGFLILFVGRHAVNDIQQLAETLSVQGAWSMPLWLEGSSFQKLLVAWLPVPAALFEAMTGEQGQFVLPAMLNFTENIGTFVSGAFLILFLSIYWSINQIHFERLWLSLLPSEQRKRARGIWRTIEPDLGAYIRSELIQSLLAVLLLGAGYWLLGSPFPVLLALLGALAWLVPVVGVLLAVIPLMLIGMLTSVQLSLITVLYTVIVVVALQVLVEPRLYRRNWNSPILTLIIMVAMADAFGLIGIIIAPPVSVLLQIVWKLLVSNRLAPGAAIQILDLKERQEHLRTVIAEMEESVPPLVLSSMERLTALLEKAEPILPVVSLAETSESRLPLS
ncbi:MAG: AI-2E family transporter [Anaerolineales bacterium]|nr:AI-2E family transporter [Anaerolineales bacterium]